MALFKISRGSRENLPTVLSEGHCWYTFDDSLFYIDFKDESGNLVRKALNAKDAETLTGASLATILNSSEVEIPTSKAVLDALADYAKIADLAPVATSGLIDDLSIGDGTELIFYGGDCGLGIEINEAGGEIFNITDPNETMTTENNEAGGQTAIIN